MNQRSYDFYPRRESDTFRAWVIAVAVLSLLGFWLGFALGSRHSESELQHANTHARELRAHYEGDGDNRSKVLALRKALDEAEGQLAYEQSIRSFGK